LELRAFTEGMARGAGYLAIAGIIFGKWKILNTTFACLLFGAATAMQFQLRAMGISVPNALLIMMPYLLALLAVAGLVGRQTAPAALAEPPPRVVAAGRWISAALRYGARMLIGFVWHNGKRGSLWPLQ
jgi:ABC-type uncharacterized transport system permease subunit